MSKSTVRLDNWDFDSGQVFLIAEIGINHNGDLQLAKQLIDAAFASRWHCVKFQKRTPELCVPESEKANIRDTPWGRMTYLDYRHRIEFGEPEYSYIASYCREKPIHWTASVWDIPSLEFVLKFDVPFIKIPSAKMTEHALVTEAAKSGKPVFVSTGMSTLDEVDAVVNLLEKGCPGGYALMHTNSTYPTPVHELNLRLIPFLKERYKCLIGYSGHEFNLEPSVIAASLGAQIIERHVTMDHALWGSDQSASLEVHAMSMLERRLRDVGLMLGSDSKTVTPGELKARKRLRGE
jgi:N-acetylneuraminate synthase